MAEIDTSKLTDRELLLIVHERQSNMAGDVKEMKEGTNKELSALTIEVSHLKETKADKAEMERLSREQSRLYNYLWFAFGVLAVLQIIIPFIIPKIIK